MKVCKFGGTSLADAQQFLRVAAIVKADDQRRYIVVSAPGKRSRDDIKVTDLLFECWQLAHMRRDFDPVLADIKARFEEIIIGLQIEFDLDREIEAIRTNLSTMPHRDYMMSRGEYLSARIMSVYLGFPFVDPALCVRFDDYGVFDEEQTGVDLSTKLADLPCAVIAGFYGSRADGSVQTFSRGGSDITGAIVAEAVKADLYENWTDVSGLLAADPGIITDPHVVDRISYRELRILSYMGASVLHADAVRPVQRVGIPINIRNTNRPEDPGTMIVYALPDRKAAHTITGVTGRKGLSVVQVEKAMVSDGAGYTAILLDIFRKYRIPFEQCITGIDTISVVIRSDVFASNRAKVLEEIRSQLAPDTLTIKENLCMIAVVGGRSAGSQSINVRILNAVAQAGVEIDTINQGAGELNLIIGVAEEDYKKTITAIYGVIEQEKA